MSDHLNENVLPENKPDNRTKLLIVIIILLVAGNIYLYWKLNQKQDVVEIMVQQTNMDSIKIADLDLKYNSAMNDIEGLRGQNSSLDSLLNIKENEIKTMKAALDAAKKAGKLKDNEYLAKLNDLQKLIADLKGQITQLETEKNILISEKESLGRDLNEQVVANTELKTENKILSLKAGLLKAENIVGAGVRGKGKGKEVVTESAKKTERIKVCFDVDENKSADQGSKTFLLRLIGPNGSVINVPSMGSGKFELGDSGEESVYTTKQTITYNQKKQNICIYWGANGSTFEKGKYSIELFQDGYSTGKKDFTLK